MTNALNCLSFILSVLAVSQSGYIDDEDAKTVPDKAGGEPNGSTTAVPSATPSKESEMNSIVLLLCVAVILVVGMLVVIGGLVFYFSRSEIF